MVRILTLVAVSLGLAFFGYGVAIGRPLWLNVVFMLGIIVANVPEGLLPTLTLALAMGGLRLAKKRVLVKSLNAVEALGSIEVICTDKTGTLTKNELAVSDAVDASSGEPLDATSRRRLLEVAVAASEIHQQGGRLTGDHHADRARRESRDGRLEALTPDAAAPPEGSVSVCGCSLGVLETLRPDYANILRRIDVDGEPLEDTARALSIAPNNAKVRLHRARRSMRAALLSFCGTDSARACLTCDCEEAG